MRKLSLIAIMLVVVLSSMSQSPHGKALKLDCSDCHTTGNWKYTATSSFLHSTTNFALEGQHQFTDCKSCHSSLIFKEAKTNCVDCHTDMHNNMLGLDCARCHDANSWIISNVTDLHQQSRFPLLGTHRTADCSDCHLSSSLLEFKPLGIECVDCHRQNYEQTTNPNHVQSNLSLNCSECHLISSAEWSASGFNHSFFPLTKGHALNDCAACHTNGLFESVSNDCYSCHQNDFESSLNPSHSSSNFTTNCIACHTTDPNWQPAEYLDHDINLFPIYSGEHKGEWEQCSDCHTQANNFSYFSCTDCHEHNQPDMNGEHQEVNGYTYDSFSCFACHPRGSKDEVFNHNSTNFPLLGQHRSATCLDCHSEGFSTISVECVDCHTENYNQAIDPKHLEAGISLQCKDCHDENAWQPSSFNHLLASSFELSGGHTGRQCSDCHIGTTANSSPDCYSCHNENYNQATDHLTLGFPHDCLQCHNNIDWKDANFDHNTTNFPLTGSHIATDCSSCHTNGYTGTSSECSACHLDNYNQAVNPSHIAAGISNTCEDCHGTLNWIPSNFSHIISTGFELSGGHAGRQCSDCHVGTTANSSPDCYSCHNENYNQATDHLTLGFPHDCLQCHNNVDWKDANFDHNTTNFPLTGSHIATDCISCHSNGYTGTSALCSSCHLENYNQAVNPSHMAAGISNICEDCHGTFNWISSNFSHIVSTGFELSGGHAGKQCSDCHIGTTANSSLDCYSCHNENYNQATDHLTLGFPHDCLQCHNNVDWNDANFDHNSTNFPLTGSHIATDCISCHSNGYTGTSALCSSCHLENYNQAVNPSHTAAGISNICEDCHGTVNWIPSNFSHIISTGFELSGGHSGRQCSECHIGTTANASPDCYSCHNVNYDNATDHLTLGFPHDCLQCHNNVDWNDANFDHNSTNFPLTGSHIATDCISCHTNGYTGTSSECSSCHQSNYDRSTNPNHTSIGLALSCEDCHSTNSGWEPASFPNHNSYYALNGAHASIAGDCFLCHSGNYVTTPNSCYACHTNEYNNTTNPSHIAASFPIDCAS